LGEGEETEVLFWDGFHWVGPVLGVSLKRRKISGVESGGRADFARRDAISDEVTGAKLPPDRDATTTSANLASGGPHRKNALLSGLRLADKIGWKAAGCCGTGRFGIDQA
jgi:hypothetical protein